MFEEFLRKVDVQPEMKKAAKLFELEVQENVGYLEAKKRLSGYTQVVEKRATPSTGKVARGFPVKIRRRSMQVGFGRGLSMKQASHLYGRKGKITPAQTMKLRAKGVKAGVFSPAVLSVPVNRPPFAAGREQFQPSRQPFYIRGERAADSIAEGVLDTALQTWGFT